VAPTMHGSLHNSILTASLRRLAGLGVRVVPPREDYGKHNLPDEVELVAEVCRAVSASPLAGVAVLVTGGPTPVPIDDVRRITSRFTGKLGVRITEELYLRGADVRLIHGEGTFRPPDHLPWRLVRTYDEYRDAVIEELAAKEHAFGIFSAAVADYRPKQFRPGKIPSGGALTHLELEPTAKVIELVRERFPRLHMTTFKYLEGVDHGELMRVAAERLDQGSQAVVANRGEESGPGGAQVAYLTAPGREPLRRVGKRSIAAALADHLEAVVGDRAGERG
jgi:phosphopantothenoylcysteine decarboxylase / phosphopantothenate---cysteine ligase